MRTGCTSGTDGSVFLSAGEQRALEFHYPYETSGPTAAHCSTRPERRKGPSIYPRLMAAICFDPTVFNRGLQARREPGPGDAAVCAAVMFWTGGWSPSSFAVAWHSRRKQQVFWSLGRGRTLCSPGLNRDLHCTYTKLLLSLLYVADVGAIGRWSELISAAPLEFSDEVNFRQFFFLFSLKNIRENDVPGRRCAGGGCRSGCAAPCRRRRR